MGTGEACLGDHMWFWFVGFSDLIVSWSCKCFYLFLLCFGIEIVDGEVEDVVVSLKEVGYGHFLFL